MTITFHCPHCGGLCAFDDRYAGRRARCTSCQQLFIIPSQNGQKPQKVKVKERLDGAISGFYRAVFVGSWKAFVGQAGIAGLVFVTVVVCFKFFVYENYAFAFYSPLAERTIVIPAGLVIFATALLWKTGLYNAQIAAKGYVSFGLHLAACIWSGVIGIIAARSVGLFCRHYGCYLPW